MLVAEAVLALDGTVSEEDHGMALRLCMPLMCTLGSLKEPSGRISGSCCVGEYGACGGGYVMVYGAGKRLSCAVCAGRDEWRELILSEPNVSVVTLGSRPVPCCEYDGACRLPKLYDGCCS